MVVLGNGDRIAPKGEYYKVAECGFVYAIVENLRLKRNDCNDSQMQLWKSDRFSWLRQIRWT